MGLPTSESCCESGNGKPDSKTTVPLATLQTMEPFPGPRRNKLQAALSSRPASVTGSPFTHSKYKNRRRRPQAAA